jgi:hypothetical protein
VAEQAQPHLAIDDDRPPTRRIAAGPGEGIGQGVLRARRTGQRAQSRERDGGEATRRAPGELAAAGRIRDPSAAASEASAAAAGIARTATPFECRGS